MAGTANDAGQESGALEGRDTPASASREREGSLLPGYRTRHDGWTVARQRAFLLALSQTGCVRDASARVGISNNSAYRMRSRSEAFAQAWERALAEAAPTIEQAAYTRAVQGWDEIVYRQGEEYTRRRRYSDSLLRLLLQRGEMGGTGARPGTKASAAQLERRAQEAAKAAGGYFSRDVSGEEAVEAMMRRLDAIEAHRARERARAKAAGAPGSALDRHPRDGED